MHMVSKRDLDSAELETMRTLGSPTTVMTANGEVQTREEVTVYVRELDLFKLCFLKKLPQFFPWGNSARFMGKHTTGSAVRKNISSEMARELIAIFSNFVPFVVLVYRQVLQLHLHLLLHHLHHRIPYLMSTDTPKIQYQREVEVRVVSFGETRCVKPQKSKTKIKNGESEEVQYIHIYISHELRDWLQEFRENLVDESTSTEPWQNPEQGTQDTSKSSHELPMEPVAKVEPGSGKHSVYTRFPKDPNCDICLKTKITWAFWRRLAGTVVPRAELFGELITAGHKVLSEESQ